MHMNDNSPAPRKVLTPSPRKILTVPPISKTTSSYINGVWYPKPGAQRMSKARFRLRAKIWRKTWLKWLKEHKSSWIIPLVLNILAVLCVLTFTVVGVLLGILLAVVGEILFFVYSIKSLLFCLGDKFHSDTKMRLRDLGIPPGSYMFLAFVGGGCLGLGTEFGNIIPCIGLVALIISLVIMPLLMHYKEGSPDANAYGPAPDDAPTEEELANKEP